MSMVMAISDQVVVMDLGHKIAEGAARGDPQRPARDQRLPGRRAVTGSLEGPDMSLLEVKGLQAGYGIVEVLFGIDLEVDAGELVVVLGANGAGKTTTLRAISGHDPGPRRGHLRRRGDPRQARRRDRRARESPTSPRAGARSPT